MKNKSIGFYLTAGAVLCTLLALILGIVTGVEYKDLSALTVVLLIAGLLAEAFTMFRDYFGISTIIGTVCTGAGIMILVVGRLNKIGLILNGVVEEGIPAAFTAAVIFALIAMILDCAVGFIGTKKRA